MRQDSCRPDISGQHTRNRGEAHHQKVLYQWCDVGYDLFLMTTLFFVVKVIGCILAAGFIVVCLFANIATGAVILTTILKEISDAHEQNRTKS